MEGVVIVIVITATLYYCSYLFIGSSNMILGVRVVLFIETLMGSLKVFTIILFLNK
jgi:hypothetical protein